MVKWDSFISGKRLQRKEDAALLNWTQETQSSKKIKVKILGSCTVRISVSAPVDFLSPLLWEPRLVEVIYICVLSLLDLNPTPHTGGSRFVRTRLNRNLCETAEGYALQQTNSHSSGHFIYPHPKDQHSFLSKLFSVLKPTSQSRPFFCVVFEFLFNCMCGLRIFRVWLYSCTWTFPMYGH